MGWVLDLDGVVWLADAPIPGASGAVARLRDAGEDVVFITNNSNATLADVVAKLAAHGIPSQPGDVVSSAVAATRLLRAGERVLVCGGPGAWEAVERAGGVPVPGDRDERVDAVLVGFHREFDYERLRIASTAARDGARLLATNDDATYPTPDGAVPGCGSLLAAVECAAGLRATIAGKPYGPMAEAVRDRLGPDGIVVGDRPDTDGRFASTVGYQFGLVLSGVTAHADLPVSPSPDAVAADLADLVDDVLGRSPT